MALVLDELVLSLGIDAKGLSQGEKAAISLLNSIKGSMEGVAASFNQGEKDSKKALDKTKKNAENTGKEMEKSGKRAAGFFAGIRKEILALAGVTLTLVGINSAIQRMSGNLQTLGTNAKAFGMTAKELDGYRRTFEQGGATKEDADSILSKISVSKATFTSNGGHDDFAQKLLDVSARVGGNIHMSMTAQEMMRELSRMFGGMSNDNQIYYGSMLGLNSPSVQVMSDKNFNAEVEENTRKSKVTEQTIKENRKFREAMKELGHTFESIGQKLMMFLLPYLTKFTKWLEGVVDWFTKNPQIIEDAFKAFKEIINEIVGYANKAADAVGGWGNAIKYLVGGAVGGLLLSWFGSLSRIATSLSALTFNPAFITLLTAAAAFKFGEYLANTETGKEIVSFLGGAAYAIDDFNPWLTTDGKFFWTKSGMDQYLTETNTRNKIHHDKLQKIRSSEGGVAKHLNSKLFYPKGHKGVEFLDSMDSLFGELETQYNLPEGLLKRMAWTESRGNPNAVSGAGARGLFQFMPDTATDQGLVGDDVLDPEKSTKAAAKYMRWLMDNHDNNLPNAVAAYNWGTGNIKKWEKKGGRLPKETYDYVSQIVGDQYVNKYELEQYLNIMSQNVGAGSSKAPVINADNSQTTNINGSITIQSNARNIEEISSDVKSNYPSQTALRFSSGVTN